MWDSSIIYEGCLKSSWTGGSAPLLCCYASLCIIAASYEDAALKFWIFLRMRVAYIILKAK